MGLLRFFAAATLLAPTGLLTPGAAGSPETPRAPAEQSGSHVASAPSSRSYLIVPPENRSENRNLYWLGEALSEAMEEYLAWAGSDVASRDERRGIEREEMGIGPLMVPTIATRLKEAEELKVDRLVIGSFTARGAGGGSDPSQAVTVNVSFRVLDVPNSRKWAERTIGPMPLSDIGALQRSLGQALLEAEGLPRPASSPPPPPASETSAAAYEARVKALLEEDPDKQARYLSRALQADPDYLRARLELAGVQKEADRPEEALATLTARALRGEAKLAGQAERLAGEIMLEAGRPTPAIDALRRSLRWNEEASTHLLLARALVARGDLQIASAEMELARRLDPDDPEIAEVRALLASPPRPVAEDVKPASP